MIEVNYRGLPPAERTSKDALGYVGVVRLKTGRYKAQITVAGTTRYIGTFGTLNEAAWARKHNEILRDGISLDFDALRRLVPNTTPAVVPRVAQAEPQPEPTEEQPSLYPAMTEEQRKRIVYPEGYPEHLKMR